MYRAAVGCWSAAVSGGRIRLAVSSSLPALRSPVLSLLYLFLLIHASALLRHGDIKPNPGPSTPTSSPLDPSPSPPLPSRPLSAGTSRQQVSSPAVSTSIVNTDQHVQRTCEDARTLSTKGKDTSTRPAMSPPPKPLRELRVAVLNARSIANKLPEFQRTIVDICPHQPDIVAVTETWLNDQIPDNVIVFPGYSALFCTDQSNKRGRHGGGVLILVRDGLPCLPRPDLQLWSESVWVEFFPSSHRPFILGCVARHHLTNRH